MWNSSSNFGGKTSQENGNAGFGRHAQAAQQGDVLSSGAGLSSYSGQSTLPSVGSREAALARQQQLQQERARARMGGSGLMANRRGLDSQAAFGGGGFGVQQFSAPGANSSLGAPQFGTGGFGAPTSTPLGGFSSPQQQAVPSPEPDPQFQRRDVAAAQPASPQQPTRMSPPTPQRQQRMAEPARQPAPVAYSPAPARQPAPDAAAAPTYAARPEGKQPEESPLGKAYGDSGPVVTSAPAPAAAASGFGGSAPPPEEKEEEEEAAAALPQVIGIKALDFSNMRNFLVKPLPYEAGCVQCYIERDKKGLGKRLYPVYSLYMKEGDRFLLAGKKRAKQKTSNYLVSMSKTDMNRDGSNFLGKLRSNFVGTEFTLYDDGAAPDDAGPADRLRREMGLVMYASNIMTSRGPRKMKVAVPKVDLPTGHSKVFRPTKEDDTMSELHRNGHTQDMVQLINKPPKWNDTVGAYVLNFNGRVTMASVKNFQLVQADDHERVVLQFGRVGKDLFTMDMMWPLSPLQAFLACLSSFDYKLACE